MNMCVIGQPDLTDEEPKSSARVRSVTLQALKSSPECKWGIAEWRPTAEEFLVWTATNFRANHQHWSQTKYEARRKYAGWSGYLHL
jgi:hypothetical protein